jgi:hypothetical protein
LADNQEFEVVPAHVRRFILLSVPSVPHLEAILLLREEPSRRWDAGAVARRLYMKPEAAAAILVDLVAAGIITLAGPQSPDYTYQPNSEELRDIISDVAACYIRNLRTVTHLIHSKTATQAQQFADAFKLRKDS